MGQDWITLSHVSKAYKKQEVIRDLSVSFEKGKRYGIMGYNGSGKSVLLKMIVGFAFADSGEIRVGEQILKKDMDFLPNAGVVINAPEFMNGLSGLDNLRFLAEIKGKIGEREIEETLKTMGLFEARKKKVGRYSMGMKQRLRLAQALMEKPDILILDEPMNALDKEGIALVKKLLNEYMNEERILIFTSDNKEDFLDLADECFEWDGGKMAPVQL